MILVPDASVAVEILLQTEAGAAAVEIVRPHDLVAPELIDAETLSGIRRAVRLRRISAQEGRKALADLTAWPVRRLTHRTFLGAAFDLRDSLSAYDALYVAVALALDARLVTVDRRLARAVAGIVPVLDPSA